VLLFAHQEHLEITQHIHAYNCAQQNSMENYLQDYVNFVHLLVQHVEILHIVSPVKQMQPWQLIVCVTAIAAQYNNIIIIQIVIKLALMEHLYHTLA
jgi:hypothetical protein